MATAAHRITRAHRTLTSLLLVGSAVTLAACGVSGPDESKWQDVSSFAWPETMAPRQYETRTDPEKVLDEKDTVVTVQVMLAPGDKALVYKGRQMEMHWLKEVREGVEPRIKDGRHFLTIGDTLMTAREGFGAEFTYALVAPLEKNRTWTFAYKDDTIATWSATIIERYSHWVVEGTAYTNVLAVKYQPVKRIPPWDEVTRFYAQGVGEIMTVKHHYGTSSNNQPAPPQEMARTALIRYVSDR